MERAGVDVENVNSRVEDAGFRLAIGMDKRSSEDHLDATDNPLSEQSLIELRKSITCCASMPGVTGVKLCVCVCVQTRSEARAQIHSELTAVTVFQRPEYYAD